MTAPTTSVAHVGFPVTLKSSSTRSRPRRGPASTTRSSTTRSSATTPAAASRAATSARRFSIAPNGSTWSTARSARSPPTAEPSPIRPATRPVDRPGQPVLRLAAAAGRHLRVQRRGGHDRQQPLHLQGRQRRRCSGTARAADQRRRAPARRAGAGRQHLRRRPPGRDRDAMVHGRRRPQRVPGSRSR